MHTLSSELLKLVNASAKVAKGRFDGLVMWPLGKEVGESFEFSYVFSISANLARGFNPASFPTIANHGANWLARRLGIPFMMPKIEPRYDQMIYVYTVNLAGPLPVLSHRMKVRALLDSIGIGFGNRLPYFVASQEFEAVIANLPKPEWPAAVNKIVEKWKGRGCDPDVLVKVGQIVFEKE